MTHFVSASCNGETCGMCYRNGKSWVPATHKVGEEIPGDYPMADPRAWGHNLTQYVCCQHFGEIVGPMSAGTYRGCGGHE